MKRFSYIKLIAIAASLGFVCAPAFAQTAQRVNASYRIEFRQGKSDIDFGFSDNQSQLRLLEKNLDEVVSTKGFVLDSVIVVSNASPEGSWSSNDLLSMRRGESVRRYLLGLGSSTRFITRSVPENWAYLDKLVSSDPNLTTSEKNLYYSRSSIIDLDRRETAMHRDSYYPYVSERLYPRLRVVEVAFFGRGDVKPVITANKDLGEPQTKTDTVYIREKEIVKEIVKVPVVRDSIIYVYPPQENDGRYRWAVSTNLGKWAFFGTANLGIHLPLARSWSAEFGGRYNPWTFQKNELDKRVTWRERTLYGGVRGWANGCFEKGFFMGAGAQWMQFNRGGVFGDKTYEGSAIGAYLKAGYQVRISDHWRFEAGLGAFCGYADYDAYTCSVCGQRVESGKGWRIAPDELNLSIVYVF